MKILRAFLKDIFFILSSTSFIGLAAGVGISFMAQERCPLAHGSVFPSLQMYTLIAFINILAIISFYFTKKKSDFPKRFSLYIICILLIYSYALYQLSVYCF